MFTRLLLALFASHSNSIGIVAILIVYTKMYLQLFCNYSVDVEIASRFE